PKPHHQLTPRARPAATGKPKRDRRPGGIWRVSAQPSMSQTATVIGIASAGKKLNGAIASAPVAPAASAIRRRRQPEARMIEAASASMAGFLERNHVFYRECAKDFRAFPS